MMDIVKASPSMRLHLVTGDWLSTLNAINETECSSIFWNIIVSGYYYHYSTVRD